MRGIWRRIVPTTRGRLLAQPCRQRGREVDAVDGEGHRGGGADPLADHVGGPDRGIFRSSPPPEQRLGQETRIGLDDLPVRVSRLVQPEAHHDRVEADLTQARDHRTEVGILDAPRPRIADPLLQARVGEHEDGAGRVGREGPQAIRQERRPPGVRSRRTIRCAPDEAPQTAREPPEVAAGGLGPAGHPRAGSTSRSRVDVPGRFGGLGHDVDAAGQPHRRGNLQERRLLLGRDDRRQRGRPGGARDDPLPDQALVEPVPGNLAEPVPVGDAVDSQEVHHPRLLAPRRRAGRAPPRRGRRRGARRRRDAGGGSRRLARRVPASTSCRGRRRSCRRPAGMLPGKVGDEDQPGRRHATTGHATTAGGRAASSGATAARISCARWSKVWRASTAARARAARAARASGSAR